MALSLGSPPLAVSQHRALRSSDFPRSHLPGWPAIACLPRTPIASIALCYLCRQPELPEKLEKLASTGT